MKNDSNKKIRLTDVLLPVILTAVGGFHEYVSCALAAVLSVVLLIRLEKSQTLRFRKDLLSLAVGIVCLGYALTCLWAIDRGMAFVGFLKFLPLGLYLLCLWQEENESRTLNILPYFGAAMAAVSALGMQFEATKSAFSVVGRLAGFFQYPNTFAIFLLVCQLLLLKKQGKRIWDYFTILVLVGGLLYTGSRTVFVLFAVSNAAMLFVVCPKKTKALLLGAVGAVCLLVVIFALDESSVLRRYLTISLTESTFVGRLLYAVDALPLLLKYPFGMGYMGYYYVQSSIQTGVYSVAYIHNDFLQILLDVGLIPGGLFAGAVIGWFFRKDIPAENKIIAGALCLHSLLDFNLQYIGMFLLLMLLMHQEKPDGQLQLKNTLCLKTGFTAVTAVGLYLCAALLPGHVGLYELSDFLYPFNTQNKLTMLSQADNLSRANTLADEILAQNTHHFAPYSAKAKYAASKGDFGSLILYKNEVFARNPFEYSEYDEYCRFLIEGIEIYRRNGDVQSVQVCQSELRKAAGLLAENENRLSALGKLIDDQPVTLLAGDIQYYISQMEDAK